MAILLNIPAVSYHFEARVWDVYAFSKDRMRLLRTVTWGNLITNGKVSDIRNHRDSLTQ